MPNWKKVIVSGSNASLTSLSVTNNVTAQSFTGSLQGTSSYSLQSLSASFAAFAASASFATTASYALNGGGGSGVGTGSAQTFNVTSSNVTWSLNHNLNTNTPIVQVYDSSYSAISPASIVGIGLNNIQLTFATPTTGYAVISTGTPPTAVSASYALSASYLSGTIASASYALTASYVANASSFPYTGSALITGSLGLTGSLNVSGSTTQIGNNTLLGNTTLSGSIIISGSTTPGNPTASVQVYGDIRQTGYHRFDPVTTNVDQSVSASYIYVSGSTQDLYFTQNGSGYSNTSRLRWLESNLYTGLLSGGVISSSLGSTSFTITSGSALIVSLGASTGSADPYPTTKKISWNNISASLINSGSAKITYVGIDGNGQIVQQTVPWGSTDVTQWDTQVELGVVLHLSGSVVTGVYNSPQVSYGFPQRADDFLRAFGPLKISGHTLSPSGSSPTLSIIKTGGTSYNDGSNYVNNPNHPSTVIDPAVTTSKIYRYYLSGSTPVIDIGVAGAGYTTIDNTKYVDTATGTLATVGNSNWSIQRVFWIPNSPTNAFLVYYGNARYGTLLNAVNAKDSEQFTEAPNTAANAIFLGYIIIQGGANRDLLDPTDTTIIPGGLFRSVGGVGSSGTSPISTTLAGLSDVSVASRTVGDLLYYNGSQWVNSKQLSGSFNLTGSLNATSFTGSLLGTSSFADNATSSSYALSSSYVISSSYALSATSSSYALSSTSASYAVSSSYVLSSSYSSNSNLLNGLNSTSFVYTSSFNTFSSSYSTRVTNTEATASAYVTTSGSLSTRVTNTESTASSLVTASGSFSTRVTNTETTASAYVTTSGSFSTRIANTEATASAYVTTSGSLSTRVTTLETASGSFSSRVTTIESKYATTGSNTYSGNQTVTTGYITLTQVSQSLNFADDAAASAGGVPLGGLYRNGNFIAIRIV